MHYGAERIARRQAHRTSDRVAANITLPTVPRIPLPPDGGQGGRPLLPVGHHHSAHAVARHSEGRPLDSATMPPPPYRSDATTLSPLTLQSNSNPILDYSSFAAPTYNVLIRVLDKNASSPGPLATDQCVTDGPAGRLKAKRSKLHVARRQSGRNTLDIAGKPWHRAP